MMDARIASKPTAKDFMLRLLVLVSLRLVERDGELMTDCEGSHEQTTTPLIVIYVGDSCGDKLRRVMSSI